MAYFLLVHHVHYVMNG